MFVRQRHCLNCITPPHLLEKLLESSSREIREAALSTLVETAELRGARELVASAGLAVASAHGRRTILDCRTSIDLASAVVARTEDGATSADASVNRAFDGLGNTREFYRDVFDRNSIDDQGMRLDGYVHRGIRYNNAFWDGQRMVFGDGDGIIFSDFTGSLDVIGHELTHGVTEFSAGLEYWKQPGALNESMSDVFGSLVKQWTLNQTAAEADWLIGADVFTPSIGADALRSMKAPGTAYDNPTMGKDPQPDHMDGYYQGPKDNYGVHINSGIPNKAFFLAATAIGGYAWETAGHIWYDSLRASHQTTQFQEFADTTYLKAAQYGSAEQQAVADAWKQVGIRITGVSLKSRRIIEEGRYSEACADGDTRAGLAKKLESLSERVKLLEKQLKAVKA